MVSKIFLKTLVLMAFDEKDREFYMLWVNGSWKQGQWTPDFSCYSCLGALNSSEGWNPYWGYITISIRMIEGGFVWHFFPKRISALLPVKGNWWWVLSPQIYEEHLQGGYLEFGGEDAYVFSVPIPLYLFAK